MQKILFVSSRKNRHLSQPDCTAQVPFRRGRPSVMVWLELIAGLVSTALLMLTLFSSHWIESLFGVAPDAGNGSTEYGIAFLWAALSFLMFGLAGHRWRKQTRTSPIRLAAER